MQVINNQTCGFEGMQQLNYQLCMYTGVGYKTPSKSRWSKVSAGFLLFIFCHAESFEMQSF